MSPTVQCGKQTIVSVQPSLSTQFAPSYGFWRDLEVQQVNRVGKLRGVYTPTTT